MRELKDNSNINETNNPSFKEPKQQSTHSKIAEVVSSNGGQQQNMEIISYIEQTMKTLKNFGEQLKIQLDTNLIQYGMF